MDENNFQHLGENLKINFLPCTQLKPHSKNPRTHTKEQILQIAKSIQEFGFTNPILIDDEKKILAGHGRFEAAKHLGAQKIPTIYLKNMSEAQKHAYIIADNKIAENAGWDLELLHEEIIFISELDPAFDLELTGFELPKIDLILSDNEPIDICEEDIPKIQNAVICKNDDLWILGKHHLYCGDALLSSSYKKLLSGKKANMIFTDPPYNVAINGNVCGKGNVKHEEFKMASGEMSEQEFTEFLTKTILNLQTNSEDGSLHYICMDWRHIKELLSAGNSYNELKNLCVWNKTNGGMGSLYRSKHELVFVYKYGKKPHLNNIELGKHGRNRTNVWDYAGVNSFENTRDLQMHPTVKPVAMIKDAIMDCTKRGDIILDAFGGSGSTLIAAEHAKRQAYLIELEPKYCDVIIRRFQDTTGQKAVHENGTFFNDLEGKKNGEK